RLVAGGDNELLKEALLPAFARGERLLTLAFSHLRRPGPPAVYAEAVADRWEFNGTAPWLTGWGLMDDAVLGGTLPDGRFLYAIVPLHDNPAIEASPRMRLCAMTASATVSLTCRGLRVGPERVLKTITREEMGVIDTAA